MSAFEEEGVVLSKIPQEDRQKLAAVALLFPQR